MEYEEMDTEDEEREVRRLTKEELEIYHQYKEFYTIQARTKGKMPGFGYIHRLKVKEHYPGIPTDLVQTFSHPIEGEVQDINQYQNKKLLKLNKSMLWYQEDKLTSDWRRRQSYYVLIQTPTQM